MRKSLLSVIIFQLLVALSFQGCCTDNCFAIVNGGQAQGSTLTKTALQTDAKLFNPAGICGSTFASKGSCCDLKSVGAYADKLLTRMKNVFKGVEGAITQAPTIIKSLNALFELLKSKEPTGSNSDELFLKSIGGTDGYLKAKAILQALITRSASIQSQLTNAQASNSKCYTTLFQARLNSICMVCSGDADKTFNPTTQKFIVKSDFCKTLVSDCSGVLDLFVKVSHALEVTRVIRNALSSTSVQPIGSDFSEDRVSIYEECAQNPTTCQGDFNKLSKFCKEVSLIKDPKVVTITENKVADATSIKEDAATNFQGSVTKEGVKLQAAIQEKSTLVQAFTPTAAGSVQSKLTTAETSRTASATKTTELQTAQTALNSATASDLVAKAAARRASIDALVTARKAAYTSIAEVLSTYVTALQADLPTSANFDAASTSFKDATKLLADVRSALTVTQDFEKVKTTYFTAEQAALNTSPPALPQTATVVPFDTQLSAWNKLDADIQTRFPPIKTTATAYADQKKTEIQTSIDKATINKQLSTAQVNIANFQSSLDNVKAGLDTATKDLTAATELKNTLGTIQSKLANPPAVGTLTETTTSVTNSGTSVGASKTQLNNLVTKISPPAGTTAPSGTTNPVVDLATNEVTRITNEITATTAIVTRCETPFKDIFADELEAGISATKTRIATLNTAISEFSAQISTSEGLIRTAQANIQPLLTTTMNAKASWETAMIQVNNVKLNIIKIQTDQETAVKDIRIEIMNTKSNMDYTNELRAAKCGSATSGSTYSQAYCTELTTKASTLQATLTTLNQKLTDTAAPFLTQLASQNAELQRLAPTLATANSQLDSASANVRAQNTIIDTNKATINTAQIALAAKRADLGAANAKLTNDQKVLDAYKAKAVPQATAAVASKCEIAQANLALLQTLKTLYEEIKATTVVYGTQNQIDFQGTYGKFSTRITASQTTSNTIETKIVSTKTAIETSRTAVTSGIAEINTTVQADLASNTDKVNTLTNTQTSLTADQTRLQTSITSAATSATQLPPKRLLQTVSDDGDTEINDAQGVDVNNDFKAGVTVDGNLDAQTTFADTVLPPTTTTPTTEGDKTAAKHSNLSRVGCAALVAAFYLIAF